MGFIIPRSPVRVRAPLVSETALALPPWAVFFCAVALEAEAVGADALGVVAEAVTL